MHSTWRDLRMAMRALRRAPGFVVVAVVTLALGIGTSTAVFSVLDAALMRALPFPSPDDLSVVRGVAGPEASVRSASYLEVRDWAALSRDFSQLSIYHARELATSQDGAADLVRTEMVSASYFPLLGARAALGRVFTAAEDQVVDRDAVAVISHALWQRRFGGDPAVIGAELPLNRRPFTVIGVMPEGFGGVAFDADVWFPAAMATVLRPPSALEDRSHRWLEAIARRRPGVDLASAQRDLDRVSRQLAAQHPDSNRDRRAQVVPLREVALGETAPMLRALFGAALLLLVLACANVAALQLVRATAREREIAIFRALGASPARVVGHGLAEGVLLAAAGAAAGVLAAHLVLASQLQRLPDGVLPQWAAPGVDVRAALFATAAAAGCAILFGALPSLRRVGMDLAPQLRQGARAAIGGIGRLSRPRGQQLLVMGEVAVALVLLVGAGLLGRTLLSLARVEPGFDTQRHLAFTLELPEPDYPRERQLQAAERLRDEIAALPGVDAVAVGSDLPLRGSISAASLVVEGASADSDIRYYRHRVLPDYFAALGVPVLRGRAFGASDREDTPRVAIVNRSGARRLWGSSPAVGRRISFDGPEGPWLEVVGVVGDVRHRDLTSDLGAAGSEPDVYLPFAQFSDDDVEVAVRTAGDPAALAPLVRTAVASVDPDLPLYQVQTLSETLRQQTALWRLGATLLGTFALVGLVLAAIGVYGVVAFAVRSGWREIAVRVALGGRASSVVALVVRQGMALVVVGVGVGLVAAIAVSGALSRLLFDVGAKDPVTFTLVPLLLVGVALIASLVPAWRAARLEPQAVLRGD